MRTGVSREQLRRAFADTVRILRARKGISQENLAAEAGLSRAHMGAIEREKHSPNLESVYRLLPALGISFAEFAAEFDRVLHSRRQPKP